MKIRKRWSTLGGKTEMSYQGCNHACARRAVSGLAAITSLLL
jgi:hypothetical protein